MKIAQIDFNSLQQAIPGFRYWSSSSNLSLLIENLLPYLFATAGALLFIYLIIGGLELLFSLGDPKKIASAKGKVTNAILGALIVAFAFFLVRLIGILTGTGDVTNIFPG